MFVMKFKKSVLTGVLALGTIVGAGAVSAAPYSVTANDTIWKIAKLQGIDLSSLIQANPKVGNFNIICPGLELNLPGTGSGPAVPQKPADSQGTGPAVPQKPADSQGTGSAVPQKPADSQGTDGSTATSAFASEVVTLVNQERTKAGLEPLASDSSLSAMALDKAKDMYNNHYFDHTSPTYGSPFDMMKTYGIQYTYAGENIAMGQRTPQEVMTSWMNSAGHRQNILSPNYTKIGVSYYNGEWVQEFIAN
jgi:uncharacterized YkwD family protein